MDTTPETVAVDFDGTLSKGIWDLDPKQCTYEMNIPLINSLIKYKQNGGKVILWTCRSNRHLRDAVNKCKEYGLIFDAINTNHPSIYEWADQFDSPKIFADYYIDDRNEFPPNIDVEKIDKILNG